MSETKKIKVLEIWKNWTKDERNMTSIEREKAKMWYVGKTWNIWKNRKVEEIESLNYSKNEWIKTKSKSEFNKTMKYLQRDEERTKWK